MPADVLDRLYEVIETRRRERPADSYVVSLQDGGLSAIAAKIREEAQELIEAAGSDDRAHAAREAADLLFHTWVLLDAIGVSPGAVYDVLEERFGIGGHAEKRARNARGSSSAE